MDVDKDALEKELGLSDDQTTQSQTNTQPDDTKIKLGSEEYTQDQLNELVGFAKSVKEQETRYNTKFDRVWPEYSRSQTRLKELENELEQTKRSVASNKSDIDPVQAEEAKKTLKQLGVLTKGDLSELGVITREDFEQNYKVQRATEKLLEDSEDLEKKIDGSDGRPAFKKADILSFMADTGIKNLETAYKIKYESELDSWKENKLSEARKSGMNTMGTGTVPGVNKQPKDVKITKANLNDMISEALEGKF